MYASVASMIKQFNMQNIKLLIEMGYKVDVACNFDFGSTMSQESVDQLKQDLTELGVNFHNIPIPRKVTDIKNILKSIKITKKLMNDNKYALVHCHSPIGGIICRLSNLISSQYKKTKMIYTAHGFHFYKGAPLLNWLIYYPIEKVCSYFTDVLITINKEDYELAKKKMKAKQVEYVPGVGIDVDKFKNTVVDKAEKRKELGIPGDAILLLSVGELNKNKNHQVIIRALAELNNPNVHYAIAGVGPLHDYLIDLSKELGITNQLHLLGYRTDVAELYKCADVFCFPSIREGLSVSLMEAMASGLPCVVSKIRGNMDLIDNKGGYLFYLDKKLNLDEISKITTSKLGYYNFQKSNDYSAERISKLIKKIYIT